MILYGSSIQEVVRVLGVEQVGVFLFEDLQTDPEQYYSKIFNFLAIDPVRGKSLTENEHQHPRVTQRGVEFLKSLNDSPARRLFLKLAGRRYRKKVFARMSEGASAERVSLPPAWDAQIATETYLGHRWMAETFGLALQEHGYPMELPERSSSTMLQSRGN